MISGDEIFAVIVSAVLVLYTWLKWTRVIVSMPNFGQSRSPVAVVAAGTAVAAVLLLAVLRRWSSADVRDSIVYTGFYFIMGFGVTGLILLVLDRLGLSVRDDALERRNRAAGVALAGAIIGIMAAFAGANIGDGPGWWVVVFCTALSNGVLLLGWWLLAGIAATDDAITIDRDLGTGFRIAGWFAGSGLILGRAVAGDWHGTNQAVLDFVRGGLPALVLLILVLAFELVVRRARLRNSAFALGAVPALVYIATSAAVVVLRGTW